MGPMLSLSSSSSDGADPPDRENVGQNQEEERDVVSQARGAYHAIDGQDRVPKALIPVGGEPGSGGLVNAETKVATLAM
jgi:hypothetical protein